MKVPRMNESATDAEAFWAFSLEVYAKPQVAELCIALQDEYGFDVNLLLLGLWVAEMQRKALDAERICELREAVAQLNDNLVHPLRRARRWAKPSDPVAETPRHKIYGALKQVELEAERLVQAEMVETLAAGLQRGGETPTPQAAARASLERYRQSIEAPDSATAPLAQLIVKALPWPVLPGSARAAPHP
ncbi:hypothetical protein IH86_24020 [Sphingobium yanoikuyae]|nr:hypothetical protein IH86_24020 [Sphingobium yanoikuyae]TKV40670.1 hypothetical protein A0U87_23585 [Sphingobium sp. MP9-4]